MLALMLRYVENHEEAAYQYAHALVNHFAADMQLSGALCLARDIVTESTNDIRNFEGGGGGPDRRRTAAADRPCRGRADRAGPLLSRPSQNNRTM